MDRVLPFTIRPNRASELLALAEEQHGGSVRGVVARLVELSRRHCIRKCPEQCKHDRAIVCKGRKGFGLALFVFTYDQRIPTSLWDAYTVLCRGLTVVLRLPEQLKSLEDGASLDLGILDAAVEDPTAPLEVVECMPKFFESDPATVQGLKCFSADDLQLEAVLEKVDGSLGLLHPARDPDTLEIIDALPLLSSKSVGFSEDISKVRSMLEEKHPNFRLPKGVTSLIVEVVRPEVQVCVPYSYQGFRLLAVMKDGAWLTEDAADVMSKELGMERPKRLSFEALKPGGYGAGEAPTLSDVMAKAEAYVMSDNPHELEEGWVVVMKNGLRLKVKTEVYHMIHGWWSGNISLKTVRPLFEDPRIANVSWETLRMCLLGRWRGRPPEQIYDDLRSLHGLLRRFHDVCVAGAKATLRETRSWRLERLAELASAGKVAEYIRSQRGWVEEIPAEVDLESLPVTFEALHYDEVWNMIHAWWSNRISVKTMLPLLEDPRINQVPFESIRECLCGPCATEKRHQNADALKALLDHLRPIYEECKKDARQALRDTRKQSLKELKNHPMAKVFQVLRGRRGWVDAIPEEVDVEVLEVSSEAVRFLFLPRAERAERELQGLLDAAALEHLETKPLRAVLMCLEVLPKKATLKDLEADLQKPIAEDLLPLIGAKGGTVASDAGARLQAVLRQREAVASKAAN
eukprot:s495_g1.t1